MKKIYNKRGISLLSLIITIVVIIILSVAVILSISNNNPIENAKNAKDVWNKKVFEENIILLLLEYNADLSNGSLVAYFNNKVNKDIDEVRTEPDSLITVIQGEYVAVIDSSTNKIIQIIDKDLLDKVAKIKAEFEQANSAGTIIETGEITDEQTIKKYIPSYSSNEFTLKIIMGDNNTRILVSEESSIMTKEKIIACESNGIYLLGDTNKNYEIDDGDLELISKAVGEGLKKDDFKIREQIVADTDSSGSINGNDIPYLNVILSQKYGSYITKIKEEFDLKISQETNKEGVTIKDYGKVMEYIPSHTDSTFKFWIVRGNLVTVYDNMGDYKLKSCESKSIYLLGDVYRNRIVDQDDVEYLQDYINGSYTPPSSQLERIKIVSDINGDGVIDNNDLEQLKIMVK